MTVYSYSPANPNMARPRPASISPVLCNRHNTTKSPK